MATIQDVAAAAKVSSTTVSRYLNNHLELPAETAGRIDSAIEQLNYRPNVLAKRLSLGRSEAIGLLTPEIGNPFFAELAAAIENEAERRGYTVFMNSTGGSIKRAMTLLNRLEDRHVDGLIVMTNGPHDTTLAESINRHEAIVLIDEDVPGVTVPKVFVENRHGGYLATRCLLAAGHRRIAHIGGPETLFSAVERRAGYYDAMREAGIEPESRFLIQGSYSREFGKEATNRILAGGEPPTAVFAGSDFIAVGVLQAAREAGLQVPRDLSLVGFDDMMFADLLAPALTTVRQPTADLGRAGLATLLAIINKQTPPAITRLPVTLIERQSVGRPRA
jgi:LacI family transcriptional regulator